VVAIDDALRHLFANSRVFVSEADFQFALAWKIKELYPSVDIRLEYTPYNYDSSIHIDIVVQCDGKMIPIELKYPTKKFDSIVNGERIILKDHSAQDCNRYDFLKDVQRMEGILACDKYPIEKAYAVLLTNDGGYWKKKSNRLTIDDEFRIHEGVTITGLRSWKPWAGKGTTIGREAAIPIMGNYRMAWNDGFAQSGHKFRYVAIEVIANS